MENLVRNREENMTRQNFGRRASGNDGHPPLSVLTRTMKLSGHLVNKTLRKARLFFSRLMSYNVCNSLQINELGTAKHPRLVSVEGSILSATAVLLSIVACAAVLFCGEVQANETAIQTIMGEASGESLQGQIAVAEVIRNRAEFRNQTIEQVCLAPRQFSFWNDKAKAYAWLRKYGTGRAYQRASRAWYESEETQLTRGADLYYNPKTCKPRWNFALTLPRGQFGSHVFLKEIKA